MIPFSLIPEKTLYSMSRNTLAFGGFLSSFFPLLGTWLKQSEYNYSPREYASMAFFAGAFNAFFLIAMLALIGFLIQKDLAAIAAVLYLIMLLITFLTITIYPAVISIRRARKIEYFLIHAVRQILIELRSGVTLFSAMASVTVDYGETSKEFKKIVDKIESGSSELDVLAEASSSTPSVGMKKVLWQISNALKVGSDVSLALDAQLDDLTRERVEQIRRYGQELSPWTMLYMLAAIIIPSLGVTLLIVLSSFLSLGIPEIIFPVTLLGLIGLQLFFMNLVSSRRPVV